MLIVVRAMLAGVLIGLSSQAHARTHSGVEIINGYEVHFVDTGSGDEISASFQVPFGRLSESGEFIGRAHLVQKLIATQLPEHATAFTDLGSTHYQIQGRVRDAQTVVNGLLAPLLAAEWKEETFTRVRAAAVDEANGHRSIAEEDLLFAMAYHLLLPANHAWSQTPFGDPQAISRMTFASVRNYFDVNYRPENVKITIRGNLSAPEIFENVKIWTAEALNQAAQKSRLRTSLAPLSPKWAASLFGDANAPVEGERLLFIASPTEHYNLVLLEGDLRQFADYASVEKLADHLNAEPFAEEALFYVERIGHKVHLMFVTQSKEGAEQLKMEAFRRLRAEQLKGSSNAANLFHPARALYVEMGQQVEEMQMDTRFRRAYRLIDNRAAIRRYSQMFSDVPEDCDIRLQNAAE